MKSRSYASVIALGIGVLRLTTSLAYGQDAAPGNALNPRTVSSIVERDPEGLGIAVNSRTPTGLLIPPAPLVKEPTKASSGLLYRGTVGLGGVGARASWGVISLFDGGAAGIYTTALGGGMGWTVGRWVWARIAGA